MASDVVRAPDKVLTPDPLRIKPIREERNPPQRQRRTNPRSVSKPLEPEEEPEEEHQVDVTV